MVYEYPCLYVYVLCVYVLVYMCALTSRSKQRVLFCSVLFCSVLFCSVLFCSVLFCSVLFCSVLFCSVLFCSVLFCSVLFCSVLFCSVLFNKLVPYLIVVVTCVPALRHQYSKTITLMLQLGNGCSCFISYGHPSGGRISIVCRQSSFILAIFLSADLPCVFPCEDKITGFFFSNNWQ